VISTQSQTTTTTTESENTTTETKYNYNYNNNCNSNNNNNNNNAAACQHYGLLTSLEVAQQKQALDQQHQHHHQYQQHQHQHQQTYTPAVSTNSSTAAAAVTVESTTSTSFFTGFDSSDAAVNHHVAPEQLPFRNVALAGNVPITHKHNNLVVLGGNLGSLLDAVDIAHATEQAAKTRTNNNNNNSGATITSSPSVVAVAARRRYKHSPQLPLLRKHQQQQQHATTTKTTPNTHRAAATMTTLAATTPRTMTTRGCKKRQAAAAVAATTNEPEEEEESSCSPSLPKQQRTTANTNITFSVPVPASRNAYTFAQHQPPQPPLPPPSTASRIKPSNAIQLPLQSRRKQPSTVAVHVRVQQDEQQPSSSTRNRNKAAPTAKQQRHEREDQEQVEQLSMAEQAASLARRTLRDEDLMKRLLLRMTLERENPRQKSNLIIHAKNGVIPDPIAVGINLHDPEQLQNVNMLDDTSALLPGAGHVLSTGFIWAHYPPLENILKQHMEEYYTFSLLESRLKQQTAFNNSLVTIIRQAVTDLGWSLDSTVFFSDTILRDRIRCYYKTHIQNARKRLKTMLTNPTKKSNARHLVQHLDLLYSTCKQSSTTTTETTTTAPPAAPQEEP
jgi:hypothetical protein